jgi:hypothetical protein
MLACVRGRYRGETILVRACPGAERGGIAIASAARDTPAVRQLHSPRVIARAIGSASAIAALLLLHFGDDESRLKTYETSRPRA